VREHLGRVHAACRNGQNLMPVLIDAVKVHCTLGEISDVYRDVFGVYRDPAWL
jgi:methylmalonyl-CoA mutase N-terminal domain/subunit